MLILAFDTATDVATSALVRNGDIVGERASRPVRVLEDAQALIEEAELLARRILRNSQRAVRSAKETILEVIGRPLDDQLRIEGWNSYTCADQDEARELLRRFFDRSDVGRAGSNSPDR